MSQLQNTLDYPHKASNFKRSGLADWLELYFRDHGFLRIAFHNLYQIDKNMWRSNQPSPKQIEIAQKNLGIKAILNLRVLRLKHFCADVLTTSARRVLSNRLASLAGSCTRRR